MTPREEQVILELTEKCYKSNLMALRLNLLHTKPTVISQFYSEEELIMIFGSREKYEEYLKLGEK